MERLARRVIDSKNIRCHVEFEYYPLQTSISTPRRYPSTLVRSKGNLFSRVKMRLIPVERNSSRERQRRRSERIFDPFVSTRCRKMPRIDRSYLRIASLSLETIFCFHRQLPSFFSINTVKAANSNSVNASFSSTILTEKSKGLKQRADKPSNRRGKGGIIVYRAQCQSAKLPPPFDEISKELFYSSTRFSRCLSPSRV